MLKSVRILHGQSRYDIFKMWQTSLVEGFSSMGIDARIVPADDYLFPPEEKTITFGFNLVRKWSVECKDQFHVAWLVDHPGYHPDVFFPEMVRMPVNRDRLVIFSVDREWVKFAREIYGSEIVHFLPHTSIMNTPGSTSLEGRDLDVVFFGSIERLEDITTELKAISAGFWPLMERIVNEFTYSVPGRLDRLMWNALGQLGMQPDQACMAMNAFFSLIDRYHIYSERLKVLRSIKRARVHLFGSGPWNEMGLSDNIVVHDGIPYKEVIDTMSRAKLLLNHTPSLQGGGHERIFDGLAGGCAVLTTPSAYMDEQFGMDHGLRVYRGSATQDIDAMIDNLITDPSVPELVEHTQRKVMADHHMRNRAAEISRVVGQRWPDVF